MTPSEIVSLVLIGILLGVIWKMTRGAPEVQYSPSLFLTPMGKCSALFISRVADELGAEVHPSDLHIRGEGSGEFDHLFSSFEVVKGRRTFYVILGPVILVFPSFSPEEYLRLGPDEISIDAVVDYIQSELDDA